MGARHWPDDADEAMERAEERISELEAEVATLQRKNANLLESCKVRGAAMERAEAEVARLKSERDHWASDAGPDSCVAILKENERLEAEVERLQLANSTMMVKVLAARRALDYDCRNAPSRECDRLIWTANAAAHRLLSEALSATSAPTKRGPDSP